MFRFLLRLEDREPNDPLAFLTAVPNWTVGETFTTGRGENWRVLAIDTEIAEELIDQGFNGIFTVEPVTKMPGPAELEGRSVREIAGETRFYSNYFLIFPMGVLFYIRDRNRWSRVPPEQRLVFFDTALKQTRDFIAFVDGAMRVLRERCEGEEQGDDASRRGAR